MKTQVAITAALCMLAGLLPARGEEFCQNGRLLEMNPNSASATESNGPYLTQTTCRQANPNSGSQVQKDACSKSDSEVGILALNFIERCVRLHGEVKFPDGTQPKQKKGATPQCAPDESYMNRVFITAHCTSTVKVQCCAPLIQTCPEPPQGGSPQ